MPGIQKKKLIFLHIPKAGGTTLTNVIRKNYERDRIYTLDGTRDAMLAFKNFSKEKIAKYDCVQGHMGFGFHKLFEGPVHYITILREPIERVISLYFYIKRTPSHYLYESINNLKIGLKDFVSSELTHELYNGQTRLLAAENGLGITFRDKRRLDDNDLIKAKEHFRKHFAVIGVLERFNDFLLLAQQIFEWKNILYEKMNVAANITRFVNIDDEIIGLIRNNNLIDIALYNYVKSLLEKRLSQSRSQDVRS